MTNRMTFPTPEPLSFQDLLHLLERPHEKTPSDKLQESEELYWEALESANPSRAKFLYRKAIELDPGNLSAIHALMGTMELTPEQSTILLPRLIDLAAIQLGGAPFFEAHNGFFWGLVQTRPYMRLRAELAKSYANQNRLEEAIQEWRGLLELCRGDNLGLRFLLPCALLATGRLVEARQFLETHLEEIFSNTSLAYCQVLEQFLSQDEPLARNALSRARAENPHTEGWITSRRKLREPKGSWQEGEPVESLEFAWALRLAWQAHPKALRWLKSLAKIQLPLAPPQHNSIKHDGNFEELLEMLHDPTDSALPWIEECECRWDAFEPVLLAHFRDTIAKSELLGEDRFPYRACMFFGQFGTQAAFPTMLAFFRHSDAIEILEGELFGNLPRWIASCWNGEIEPLLHFAFDEEVDLLTRIAVIDSFPALVAHDRLAMESALLILRRAIVRALDQGIPVIIESFVRAVAALSADDNTARLARSALNEGLVNPKTLDQDGFDTLLAESRSGRWREHLLMRFPRIESACLELIDEDYLDIDQEG